MNENNKIDNNTISENNLKRYLISSKMFKNNLKLIQSYELYKNEENKKSLNNNKINNNNSINNNDNNDNNNNSMQNLKEILDLYKTYSNDFTFYTNHSKQMKKLKKFENSNNNSSKIVNLDHIEYKPYNKIIYKQSPAYYPKYLKTLTEENKKLKNKKNEDNPFLPKLIFHPKPTLQKYNKSLLFIDNKNLNINDEIENVNQNFFLSNRYLSHRNDNKKNVEFFQTEIETRTNTEENKKNINNNYNNTTNSMEENSNTMKFLEKKTYYKCLKNVHFSFKNPVERAKHLKFIRKFAEINLINKLKLYN
jgi:hypothetical protein